VTACWEWPAQLNLRPETDEELVKSGSLNIACDYPLFFFFCRTEPNEKTVRPRTYSPRKICVQSRQLHLQSIEVHCVYLQLSVQQVCWWHMTLGTTAHLPGRYIASTSQGNGQSTWDIPTWSIPTTFRIFPVSVPAISLAWGIARTFTVSQVTRLQCSHYVIDDLPSVNNQYLFLFTLVCQWGGVWMLLTSLRSSGNFLK